MQYKTACAISIKGDRIERGAIIEMTAKEAAVFGDDLLPFAGEVVEVEEAPVDIPLDEMNQAQLKAKAKELGLSQAGSNADLRERIALNEGAESEQSDEEEIEEDESEQSDEEA